MPVPEHSDTTYTDLTLRCAWLRANAWEVDSLRPFSPARCPAAGLRRPLLVEVADREGWWYR